MPKNKDNKINIIALIGLVITVLSILGSIIYQSAQVKGDVDASKLRFEQIAKDQKDSNARISGCEQKYEKIQTEITYIKEMVIDTNKDVKELIKNDK